MAQQKKTNLGAMKHSVLYSRTGDRGTTSLVGGKRIAKNDIRLEAYGSVDELNSFIGLIVTHPDAHTTIGGALAVLVDVQSRLFDLGAYLATDPGDECSVAPCAINADDTQRIEEMIDVIDSELPSLRSFVLPGGTQLSAICHVARTVCRRCERAIVTLDSVKPVAPEALIYINRLSDLLFAVARMANVASGTPELCWKKQTKSITIP